MRTKLRLWWQKIKQHPFITVGIVVALLAVIIFMLAVHVFGWDWTGFTGGESKITITSTSKGITTAKELQPGKALWDWLGLLATLAIPVVVGIGAAWFTAQQGKASERENTDNQREIALQAYIDKTSKLLLKEHLGERTADGQLKPEFEQVRKIARVRTITVLTQLDVRRIGYVFAFLREAGLMSTTSNDNVVSLSDADLRAVNWSQANLSRADLSKANLSKANLSRANLLLANLSAADLSGADLRSAELTRANLSRAFLRETNFMGAELNGADLSEAHLASATLRRAILQGTNLSRANLIRADLRFANLIEANLSRADFSGADLRGANLRGAKGTTPEQLDKAWSLKGATMPDGSIYP